NRASQIELKSTTQAHLSLHALLEESIAVPAIRLGAIQSKVDAFQQPDSIHTVFRCQHNSDTDADDDAVALYLIGSSDVLHQSVCQPKVLLSLIAIDRLQDRELVATETTNGLALTRARQEPLRNGLKQRVTNWVAKRVVHRFEQIEVKHEN